jgi:predicted metal-binding membrane protein
MGSTTVETGQELRPAWRLVLERERRITTAALALVAALAWLFLLVGAGMPDMGGMGPSMVMAPTPWEASYAIAIFLMWWFMMAAMMLPSAAPTILLYDLVARRVEGTRAATLLFSFGYVLVWGVFSVLAAVAHWALDQSGLLSMGMASANYVLSGVVLIVAGLWQLTPVKYACLVRCQNPLHFLSHHWRRGRFAPIRMGIAHGLHCLGCCWLMMGLLFYGGVMNLAWIGGLAIYILLEKTVPARRWLTTLIGCLLIVVGVLSISAAVV